MRPMRPTPTTDLALMRHSWSGTKRRRAGVQEWCCPTDELRTEYLQSVSSRSEADVLALLRLFLFEDSFFGRDSKYLPSALRA
jgi:hypothetical protein